VLQEEEAKVMQIVLLCGQMAR